jgi:hypothetical protein
MRKSLGKAALKFGLSYARRRYGRQILIGLGVGVLAVAGAAYLTRSDAQEG